MVLYRIVVSLRRSHADLLLPIDAEQPYHRHLFAPQCFWTALCLDKTSSAGSPSLWYQCAHAGSLLGLPSIVASPLPVQCCAVRDGLASQQPAVGGCGARQAQSGYRRGILALPMAGQRRVPHALCGVPMTESDE
jgi:hypothetical protein